MNAIKKVKNGNTIIVEEWSNDVKVYAKNGELLGIETFSDHIKAVEVAVAL